MLENRDCSSRKSCVNNECVNPCNLQVCGVRAQCDVENHVPVCSCPQRYTGNPFQYCNEIDPKTFCSPSPCGSNANCNVVRDVPTCSCPP
ncbi:unnamed protein product, partial [Timema podura]|nr:unnamed protein product [Timema podura]